MSVRKVVLIVVAVNLAFVAALGGLYWSQSARAQGGDQPRSNAPEAVDASFVPGYMDYQGVVYDNDGNPLQGSYDLTFTLYSCSILPHPTCTSVWSGTYTLDLVDGLFNARLGAIDPTLFEPRTLLPGWHLELGVSVDGGAELAPRTLLNTTVPYAFASTYTESMPEPDFDTGWTPSSGGALCGSVQAPHNLGGDLDDYVVRLDCQRPDMGVYDCTRNGQQDAAWFKLTTTDIQVDPCVATNDALDFRVRIWVTR